MNIAYNSTMEELECLATTHVNELTKDNLVYLLNHFMQRAVTHETELETANERIEELEGEAEMLDDQVAQAQHDRDTTEDDLTQLKSDIMELIQ